VYNSPLTSPIHHNPIKCVINIMQCEARIKFFYQPRDITCKIIIE